ncbi:MAG: methyltetrahydrofolate cobalamin methyltransferase [Syntrophobacteraceae bacterium]
MLIIGERINSSRKSIAGAISSGNREFIQQEAKLQAEAGASYIDVNAAAFVGEEIEKLKWVIDAVQEAVDLPLCIDSPDPGAIRAVLPLVNQPPMINSITLEPARLEGILPLVAEYKAKVIGLCQSEDTMAESTEAKVDLAGKLVRKVRDFGISPDDLYIDPLVYPLGTSATSAQSTLEAIERIMNEFPGVHTTCGLTNVSHGLPARKLVNRTFLAACIIRGLDSAIMDPTDKLLYGSLKAAVMIAGKDDYCMEFITAFRAGHIE